MTPSPILIEILVALGAGNITIGPIHCEDSGHYVEGYAVVGRGKGRGAVRINPAHNVVDTTLHELTHRLHPKWSERKVRAETAKMMRALTSADVDTLYTLILSVAKVKKRPVVMEIDD